MRLTTAILVLGIAVMPARGAQRPDLDTVLGRTAEYVGDYYTRMSAIVAEERYIQRIGLELPSRSFVPGGGAKARERTLRSDFVIVRGFAGERSWIGVRDVFEIDGEPVEGERGRLQALLSDTRPGLGARIRALADQQAKYNLGDVYRTINVPTLPLEFLLRDRQPRFHYKRAGTIVKDGRELWIVTFKEHDRPTLIRTPDGRDVVSTGTFWIDPDTGAVLRSELRADERRGRVRSIILVGYTPSVRFAMLLPDDMNEQYLAGRTRIEGHATYSNFRRFETEVRIK